MLPSLDRRGPAPWHRSVLPHPRPRLPLSLPQEDSTLNSLPTIALTASDPVKEDGNAASNKMATGRRSTAAPRSVGVVGGIVIIRLHSVLPPHLLAATLSSSYTLFRGWLLEVSGTYIGTKGGELWVVSDCSVELVVHTCLQIRCSAENGTGPTNLINYSLNHESWIKNSSKKVPKGVTQLITWNWGQWLQLTFFCFITKTSYVHFVPGGVHLGIACLFHSWKIIKKGEPSNLTFLGGQKVEPFYLTFFGSPTRLWIPVVCRISIPPHYFCSMSSNQ